MKKLFVLLCVTLFGISAQAQERGDFAVGVQGGINVIKIAGLGSTSRMGIGAFGQYNLTNHWRVELEGVYHPKKEDTSDITAGLNIHYLFNLTRDHNIKLYPLLGYALAFVHNTIHTSGRGTVESENTTDGGIQLGAGLQANIGSNWFVSGEYRFQPGIFGDGHVGMIGVGYRF